MRAYALMRHAPELEECYIGSPFFERFGHHISAIRATIGPLPIRHYRGVGRYPFTEYPEHGPGWQGRDISSEKDPEPEARAELEEWLGMDDYQTPSPRAFLPELDQARRIWAKLKRPENYEIVELCTQPDRTAKPLGFDIGYWGGGNYSILCDAIIWPIWHTPDLPALQELATFAQKLNKHALFPSWKAAQEYLTWYKQQTWAETEPNNLSIIDVGEMPER